jgi:hypothetical protein
MKILDIKSKKGNIVTFILGDQLIYNFDTPLWNLPYKKVSLVESSQTKSQVIVFNFNLVVLQPHEQFFGAYISRQELLDKKYPLLTITDPLNNKKEIFIGDDFDSIPNSLIFTQYTG